MQVVQSFRVRRTQVVSWVCAFVRRSRHVYILTQSNTDVSFNTESPTKPSINVTNGEKQNNKEEYLNCTSTQFHGGGSPADGHELRQSTSESLISIGCCIQPLWGGGGGGCLCERHKWEYVFF